MAASFNAKLLPAAITHVCRIIILYPSIHCSVQYSSIAIAYMGSYSLREIVFFLRLQVKLWPLDTGISAVQSAYPSHSWTSCFVKGL